MRPQLWLVRHGPTEWSETGRHTSRTDVPLTDAGRRAARGLAPRLQEQRFELVLTSPMTRARETCELSGLAAHAEVTDDLLEWDYGDYEGLTTAEIRESRPGWSVFADDCPGGETIGQVSDRADRLIDRVRATDGPVIAFAHGHVLRVVGARWVGLSAAAGAGLVLDAATISVLGWERETPAIQRWNCR
ncbi:MAG TPA: histidine phosphatase family protein [Mycobacteriales bacterium]|jgi:probable phosphoglycerate mutase|nr:histidine phosphatase family protein [Mycobacteriales bacterium]